MELHNINPDKRKIWNTKHVEDWHEEQNKEKEQFLKSSFAGTGQVTGQ